MALELNYRGDNRVADRESAVRAAQTAIELDPELAEGHAALGLLLLDDRVLLGDTETKLERAERSLRRALDLDPSLAIGYAWLSSALQEQGRNEEANAVQEQGLLVDPLNPVLSAYIAGRLNELGERERERAERLLLRLIYLPARPANAYVVLWWHYFTTGQFDKTLLLAKDNIRAYVASEGPHSRHAGFLAWDYERLGLTAATPAEAANGFFLTTCSLGHFLSFLISDRAQPDHL